MPAIPLQELMPEYAKEDKKDSKLKKPFSVNEVAKLIVETELNRTAQRYNGLIVTSHSIDSE